MQPNAGHEFRRVDVGDLAACADLFLEVFNGPPWNESWERDVAIKRLADCLGTPGFRGWATEKEGALSSFAVGYCEPYNRQCHYFLKEMCVRPAFQRQGVGRALIARVTSELQVTGVDRIYLLTARDGDAEAFYRRCGFYVSPRMIMMSRRLTE